MAFADGQRVAHLRLGQRPRIMPTTTGAVGRVEPRITPSRDAYSRNRSKADWRIPYTPTVAKIRMPA